MSVRIYINGKLVDKEELSKYEIRSEVVKKIIANKLAEKQKEYYKTMVNFENEATK